MINKNHQKNIELNSFSVMRSLKYIIIINSIIKYMINLYLYNLLITRYTQYHFDE